MATPRARRGPRPKRYRDLIDIATDLFSQLGYEGTSVRKIADRMGVKSASLYSHIDSKEKVLREIVLDVADEFLDTGRRGWFSAPSTGPTNGIPPLPRSAPPNFPAEG